MVDGNGAPSAEDYTKAFDTLDFLIGAVEAETFQRLRPSPHETELPVVLVTGFLGAGKTTLMRRLVSGNHGLKLAAVVNDMANLNVDAALVAEAGAEQGLETLSLANGCVCCSQSGIVARTLSEIQNWAAPPEYVLIEASGVADPAALAGVVSGMSGVRLDAVVSVVDADAAEKGTDSDASRLIARGIGAADLILLNKADLVSPEHAAALERDLACMAPKAAILRTSNCAVPSELIFDPATRADAEHLPAEIADDRFSTVELVQRTRVTRQEIESLIGTLPDGVYRVKGTLMLADAAGPELLQGVGRRWDWTSVAVRDGGAPTGCLVVVYSAKIEEIAAHFSAAFSIAHRAQGLDLQAAR